MHSVPATVSAEPEVPSDAKSFAEPPRTEEPKSKKRTWVLIGAAVTVVLAVVLFVTLRGKARLTSGPGKTLPTSAGQILRLKGTTEAVQARAILAPMLAGQSVGTLTIVHLTAAGVHVKKGDPLVEFDRQAQMRDFVDKQADYQKLVNQVAEEQAKESAAKAKDETELKAAEDDLHKAELEIGKEEIVSKIDAEKNQEALEAAKATYSQLRETFDLKRKAAQAAIRILEIQRDRTQQIMLHAQSNADLMQIRSPLDGVVVLNTIWKQGTMGEVQEGDQVRPGVPFMQVVNPAAMQVRVLANQEDFPSLHMGQTAKVRLDAYPEMVFSAKLDQVAPIGEGGDFSSHLKNFMVLVSIEGNDPKLMPDLSAAVDVDLSTQNANTVESTVRGGN